jgi:glycosyltransferase involved in cell wall biosynthesis
MKPPYLIVTGDFVKTGGMDRANYEFARYLADEGFETHLAGYRVADDLASHPGIVFHRVPKLAGSYFLSEPMIGVLGRRWAATIAARGGHVLVNGGVCNWNDINWVHYVHAAFEPPVASGIVRSARTRLQHRFYLAAERRILPRARLAITNSDRTRLEVIERLGVPSDRVHTVYLGIDPSLFRPPTADEHEAARARIGAPPGRVMVAFVVGGLGDRRKGFDTLLRAWTWLCADPQWDADLMVVGGGELSIRKASAAESDIAARVKFLGRGEPRFVADVLWGCDVLVLPTRYEAYGRVAQEALCCGIPALVSNASGIAEQYPTELTELLIPDPEDAEDLAARLRRWRAARDMWRERVRPLSAALRNHTWLRMAEQMIAVIERDHEETGPARDAHVLRSGA